ncbi:MAG: tetratricopeptide repeat protein [Cyanobacteria bacterium P01_D01_bin.105]
MNQSPMANVDSIDSTAQQHLDQQHIETQFKLASLWLTKGKFERAISGYRAILALQPTHKEAALFLDHALQQQDQDSLCQRQNYAEEGSNKTILPLNPTGKISLTHQKVFGAHRCGWSYAIQALKPLHNSSGILFDGYLENSFIWKHYQPGQVRTPYRQPWVGFLHNPPAMPSWFYPQQSPQTLMATSEWQQSLEHCVGLFCLSNYQAQWVRKQTGKPVSVLIHPTEIPEQLFDFDQFMQNSQKKIVQLGWWLRQITAIQRLPIRSKNALGYEKIRLNPAFTIDSDAQLQALAEAEIMAEKVCFNPDFVANTREVSHLCNADYDQLLCENIGFIALHDTSANNAVIECIARTTPLLVNPLPAIIEYLGKDYPLYFETLAEAAQKAQDLKRIEAAHQYLKTCPTRKKLSAEYFRQSFQTSSVYQSI